MTSCTAHTFIENLDLKYDTIIGEKASHLEVWLKEFVLQEQYSPI